MNIDDEGVYANQLDRMGVPDWRARLYRARHADAAGVAFDRELVSVKADYRALRDGAALPIRPPHQVDQPALDDVRDPSGPNRDDEPF